MRHSQTAPLVSRAVRWRYQTAVQAARVINAIGRDRDTWAHAAERAVAQVEPI